MQQQVIPSPPVPAPQSSYSQALLTGSRRFISGQVPLDAQGRSVAPEDFREQARPIFRNLAAGGGHFQEGGQRDH